MRSDLFHSKTDAEDINNFNTSEFSSMDYMFALQNLTFILWETVAISTVVGRTRGAI